MHILYYFYRDKHKKRIILMSSILCEEFVFYPKWGCNEQHLFLYFITHVTNPSRCTDIVSCHVTLHSDQTLSSVVYYP